MSSQAPIEATESGKQLFPRNDRSTLSLFRLFL